MTKNPVNRPERLPSLQVELERRLAWISMGWLLAIVLTVTWGVQRQVNTQMDDALREAAEVLYGLVALTETLPSLGEQTLLPAPAHEERIVWQIVNQQGHLVRRSHGAPAIPLSVRAVDGYFNAAGAWRAYGMALPNPESMLYVAQHERDRAATQLEAMGYLGLSALLVSAFWAVLMRRRVTSAMAPLTALAKAIAGYDPVRGAQSLPPATRQETAMVRDAIAELGERLAHRVASEQAFAAHAAHALRTPLAGMDVQLALASLEANEQTLPRLERTRAAVARLKRVVESLLGFFRAQAELVLSDCAVDELASRVPVHGLVVHTRPGDTVRGDADLLSAVLANLLDNAVLHGAQQVWITARSALPGGLGAALVVEDDGPGIPPDQLAAMRSALTTPNLRHEGVLGLGLKLAALVARAHGGRLDLEPVENAERGLRITVWLSAEAPVAGEPAEGASRWEGSA